MNSMNALTVKVEGDFALFTRPEFSAERVSYTTPTPSAARGILESIFWKPEIRWRVEKILVLKPIKHFSTLRNEINTLQSDRAAKSWQNSGDGYFAEDDRAQRHSLCLRDVSYIIQAQMDLKPHATERDSSVNVAKYRDQFRRRVDRGQCFNQPYLGTREFSAAFMPLTTTEEELVKNDKSAELAIDHSEDLGWMLFDIEFTEVSKKGKVSYYAHDSAGARVAQGTAMPKFFHAELQDGVLEVPQSLYSPLAGQL
jgi:CRISPR-associated protein Cas5d